MHLRNVASHQSVVKELLSTNPALFAQVTVKLNEVRSGLPLGGLRYHLVALRALGRYGHYQVLEWVVKLKGEHGSSLVRILAHDFLDGSCQPWAFIADPAPFIDMGCLVICGNYRGTRL